MNSLISASGKTQPPWIRRLLLPAYQVKDAAKYATISAQTILNWQKTYSGNNATISRREDGQLLSYLQLIEVAVVAAMRDAGVSLNAIREAREYMSARLKAEYPFAQHAFKTDGKNIIMKFTDFEKDESKDKLIIVNKGGQLGWNAILEEKLKEFEYHKGTGVANKWHLRGSSSSIVIDPQVSFGAPAIKGIPTWTIKGRLDAGESIDDIADDFSLKKMDVKKALEFEGVDVTKIDNAVEWNH
ncbi:MAG TPA: DUF433 domain-containing protein [Burkholderiaceae bacterium]|jgi:uncharacterized protein (DUF433 family)